MSDNSDSYQTCPYYPQHKISKQKFQRHLFKCAMAHPEIAKMFKICPFNAMHRLPDREMEKHILQCPDSVHILDFTIVTNSYK